MEPVEFVAVKEEQNLDDLRIESNYLPFDPFEVEERKQELTDALKYCIDLLKDAQIILDLQNSNRTISKRSQLMGKEIRRRIIDMLYSMKFMDDKEDIEVIDCQENSISYSLENLCDSNEKELKNDNTRSVEKDASILNLSFECVDKDQSNGLYNYKNSKTGNIKNGTSNKMPRQQCTSKKEERKTWDATLMQQAINCVKTKALGYTRAANLFEVPRTTLRRLVAKDLSSEECVNTKLEQKSRMPAKVETQLIDYIMLMDKQFFNLTSNDVKKMAYQLAIRNKLNHPFGQNEEDNRAWFDHFMKRHSYLTILNKLSDHTSNFKTGFNKNSVFAFYKRLENMYKEHHYKANRIFNVDETAFIIPPKYRIPRVVGLKGRKQVGSLTTAERESLVTVIFSMSAGGTFIPPMLIFPCKNMTDSLMKGAPAGSIGRCHSSGWVQTDLFIEWFEHFIKKAKPTKRFPILLILDGSYPHARNLDVIDIARKNYVTILSIPPHTTYKMQPLDRSFMGPFKQYYSEYLCAWQGDNQRSVKQCDLVEMLGEAYLQCQTRQIAANGFKVTGIYPFNPHVFSDSEFIASTSEEESPADSTDSMSPKREMTSSVMKQHQQIEDLSQPSCSKDSEMKQNAMIIPEEIWPDIPPIISGKSTQGRKLSKIAMFTSSEYQETLKLSLKSAETKKTLKSSVLLNKNVKKM